MIGVVGAGAFGVALAVALARDGREVRLWGRDVSGLAATRRTARLAGVDLPENVTVTSEIDDLRGAEAVLLALPMQALAGFLAQHGAVLNGLPLVVWGAPEPGGERGIEGERAGALDIERYDLGLETVAAEDLGGFLADRPRLARRGRKDQHPAAGQAAHLRVDRNVLVLEPAADDGQPLAARGRPRGERRPGRHARLPVRQLARCGRRARR